jgi:hypothetical protein
VPTEGSGQARLPCAIELAAAFVGWQLFLWVVAPRAADGSLAWQAVALGVWAAAALWILLLSPRVNHAVARSLRGVGNWRTFFLHKEELARAVRNYALITLVGLIAIAGMRWARDAAALPVLTWKLVGVRLGSYLVSGLVQAAVMFEVLQPRFRALWGDAGPFGELPSTSPSFTSPTSP